MLRFFGSTAGRLMLASFTVTLLASAAHILTHSTFALAAVVPVGVALGFMATAVAMGKRQFRDVLHCLLLLPASLFMMAVGVGVGYLEAPAIGYLYGALGVLSGVLAVMPKRGAEEPVVVDESGAKGAT